MNRDVVHEAETMVLGSILMDPDLIAECYLQEEEFSTEQYQLTMRYFRYLYDNDKPIDLMVMAETSGRDITKIGGISGLTKLTESVPSTANFDYYQMIVRKSFILRRSTEAMRNLAAIGDSGAVDAHEYASNIQAAAEEIAELAEDKQQSDILKMSEVLKDHHKVLRSRQLKQGITGAKSASEEYDRLTGGHQDGDLVIIGARPSIGKTALVVNDITETTRAGRTAILFSFEMDKKLLAERFLCSIGNIDNAKLRTGSLSDSDWERWSYAMNELDRLPIFIDDTPGMTLQQIASKVKRLKKQHPRLVVYIDYLQLVNPGRKFNKDHEGVAFVSKGLKIIARKNECPVVAISAVGRQCEQRQDKRPMMSDLRESGSIESDADIIVFLYRDDYYNPNSEKKFEDKGRSLSIVELIVAKGRNVGTGTIEMAFNKKTGRFLNLNREKKGG